MGDEGSGGARLAIVSVIIKNRPLRPVFSCLVDQDEKTWNTFAKIALEWLPVLRKAYAEIEVRLNQSD